MAEDCGVQIIESLSAGGSICGIIRNALEKLPLGAVRPEGWLKCQLEKELKGLPGQLWKTSPYLTENNAWLHPENDWHLSWRYFREKGLEGRPWEEQPYWLRTFVPLAVLTGDAESIRVAKRYMDAMIGSVQPDGWFGPEALKHYESGNPEVKETLVDVWPHMVVSEAVLSWYEYTGETRWIGMLHGFLKFCDALPEEQLCPRYNSALGYNWPPVIQRLRAADLLPTIFRVMEITGDKTLEGLAHKIYRRWRGPYCEFMDIHTVNFAQQFAYGAVYSRISHRKWHRNSSDYWYNQHLAVWGTVPRGMYCADESIRNGCTDPRYGMESCSMVEISRSFCLMGDLNMEPVWADRMEDILYNHYPAVYLEDMSALHYITCSNQVMLDDYNLHNVCNKAHQFAYSRTANRCCLHNAGLGWPLLAEHLTSATADGGVCFRLYGPHTAELQTGKERVPVKWRSETEYPFRSEIRLTLETPRPVGFPCYIRIPRWCKAPEIKLNGETVGELGNPAGKLVKLTRVWNDGDRLELNFPAEITLTENPRNGGITVDRGPFSYSLRIPEIRNEVVSDGREETYKKAQWDESAPQAGSRWTELLPGGPWNYGLMPEKGFIYAEQPFSPEHAFSSSVPSGVIRAHGKKIPDWKLQDHMCAELQNSPVRSSEPEEKIELIPLGCARLRLSVFPAVTDEPWAQEWHEVPESTPVESRPPHHR